ncbi:MAG: flavin reductase family protein [Boseongicola sp.]
MTQFATNTATEIQFREALSRYATGVTVVTCQSEVGPLGITANSFSSLSLDPPLILWAPARASKRFAAFETAQEFAVHILAEDQHSLCQAFARNGTQFDGIEWRSGDNQVPIVDSCLARFDCTRHAVHEGGDHAIIVGKVKSVTARAGSPLVFANGSYGGVSTIG